MNQTEKRILKIIAVFIAILWFVGYKGALICPLSNVRNALGAMAIVGVNARTQAHHIRQSIGVFFP